jgi:hypothetical protein
MSSIEFEVDGSEKNAQIRDGCKPPRLAEVDSDIEGDETAMTEISFLPDGRICLFGASREIVDLLWQLNLGDESLRARYLSIQSAELPCNPIELSK